MIGSAEMNKLLDRLGMTDIIVYPGDRVELSLLPVLNKICDRLDELENRMGGTLDKPRRV